MIFDVEPQVTKGCIRCSTQTKPDDSDFCVPCKDWMNGSTDEDPKNTLNYGF